MSSATTSPLDSTTIEINEIMRLIPHRFPLLLVDRIIDFVPNESATGLKNVSINEWYFQGHFPQHPVMPGVLIIEAMAQTAGAVVMKSLDLAASGRLVYFMSIEGAKFRKPVVPGDILQLKVTKERQRGLVWVFSGGAWVGNKLTAEAKFTAMIAEN
ncbi:MAG: 3-hydroxyacyl-ACP dehydratase FabZ [Alphaproteobacteria bacterium]